MSDAGLATLEENLIRNKFRLIEKMFEKNV